MEQPDRAPVGWGLIGLGRLMTQQIAPAILRSPTSRLAACAGSSLAQAEAFAVRFGPARAHPDHRALLADRSVEAVFIATPNALHHAMVLEAAAAGKHVLCEKPLALTEAEGREMVEACRRARVLLRVGFYLRLEAVLQRAREIVRSGRLGDLRAISIARTGPALLRKGWRLDGAHGGGALFDMAVHLLDLVEWACGDTFAELSAASHPDRREGAADDTIGILGRLSGGAVAMVRASRETPHAANDLVIEGTRGMLATSSLRWSDAYDLRVTDDDGTSEERVPATPAYALEVALFEREIRGAAQALADGEAGVRAIVLAEAVAESIARRVHVPVRAPGA